MTSRDELRIEGVHADLKGIARAAWALFDPVEVLGMPGVRMSITADGGVRTAEQQRALIAAGKSWTMNSRHRTGHALDFALSAGSTYITAIEFYERVWLACWRPAAYHQGVAVAWGGYWKGNRRDGPHIELSRKEYPA